MTDIVDRLNGSLSAGYSELRKEAALEIERLRAKIAEMEKQEPVAKVRIHKAGGNAGLAWSVAPLNDFDSLPLMRDGDRLYAFPGAQAQNVPKAVAYLDLGTGGYMDIGTDLTDEALAALPKGRHMLGIVGTYGVDGYVPAQPAQSVPSVPDGWLRAIDEALIIAHIGVANAHDTYEQAREKLTNLIGWHVDVATDPAVNGGWKLVPIEPTDEMLRAIRAQRSGARKGSGDRADWKAWLTAAPEAKP